MAKQGIGHLFFKIPAISDLPVIANANIIYKHIIYQQGHIRFLKANLKRNCLLLRVLQPFLIFEGILEFFVTKFIGDMLK